MVAKDVAPGREVVAASDHPRERAVGVIDRNGRCAQGDCVAPRRLLTQRQDRTSHSRGLRTALEGRRKRRHPSRVGRAVIVGRREHVAGRHGEREIARRGEAEAGLFEISRAEWTEEVRSAQRAENSRLAQGVERWRAPLVARGELLPMTPVLFFSQIIGPAQVFCRAWLSGRDRADPREQADILIACAIRALVAPDSRDNKS